MPPSALVTSYSLICQLTPHEAQIVEAVGEGLRNQAIADRLGITEGTVKVYFSRLVAKLGKDRRRIQQDWLASNMDVSFDTMVIQVVKLPTTQKMALIHAMDLTTDERMELLTSLVR